MRQLFEQVLSQKISSNIKGAFPNLFNRIRIADSTLVQLPDSFRELFRGCGGSGRMSRSALKIFFEYDLKGNYQHVELEDGVVSETAFNDLSSIQKGDLLLRDMGYRQGTFWGEVDKMSAFYIQRIPAPSIVLITQGEHQGKLLDLLSLSKRLQKGETYHEFSVKMGVKASCQNQLGEVRLICFTIPRKQARDKEKALRKSAQRNGKKVTERDIMLCKYQFCITNTPVAMLKSAEVVAFYRLRWQIEHCFKTWKSLLGLDKVKKMKPERLLCYLYGFLIYALLTGLICSKLICEVASTSKKELSRHKLAARIKLKIDELIQIIDQSKQKQQLWLDQLMQFALKKAVKAYNRATANPIQKKLFAKFEQS